MKRVRTVSPTVLRRAAPSGARALPEEVARIVARRLETLLGPHRLAYDLGRHRSTIYGVLRREGLSRLSFIDRPTRAVVRYERSRPGELLHFDVKKLGRIREGGGWRLLGRAATRPLIDKSKPVGFDYLHVAVDDHSRVAFVQARPDERGPTCAAFLADAVAFFAREGVVIERVMTDNALNYRRSRDFQACSPRTGSPTGARAPTAPKLTAKRSVSTGRSSRSSPTSGCSPRTRNVSQRYRGGSLLTMPTDLTAPSVGSRRFNGSVNNADGNHS